MFTEPGRRRPGSFLGSIVQQHVRQWPSLRFGEVCIGGMVKPKTKILALMFGLLLPYFALAMYFAFRIREHPLPTWFPYFGLSYFLGTILLVMAFARKISHSAQAGTVEKPQSALRWIARAWAAYLVTIWSGGFLWGTYQTILGRFLWQRALPAGAFLLVFIALFSRWLYERF
jgi:hypothetical protein